MFFISLTKIKIKTKKYKYFEYFFRITLTKRLSKTDISYPKHQIRTTNKTRINNHKILPQATKIVLLCMLTTLALTLVFCTAVHLVMSCVLFLFSRYKIEYLALAWIMLIFCACFLAGIPVLYRYPISDLGIFHPALLIALMAGSYLQSIHLLGISMPGYLQWKRMWTYAAPAIALIAIYVIARLIGWKPNVIHTLQELSDKLQPFDILFRLAAFALSIYYILNIYRLPHLLVRHHSIPTYIKAYATALGLVATYYVCVTFFFNEPLLLIYLYLFSGLNLYIFFRTLETMARHLPKPDITTIRQAPEPELIEQTEQEDFNQANRQRFERVEYFMQTKREWTDSTFGRDRLCEATGINRHLLLQCLRSQGYNNIHDYINSYRIAALKSKIKRGEIQTANDAVVVGFGSGKTARNCFERMEGLTLDEYIKSNSLS